MKQAAPRDEEALPTAGVHGRLLSGWASTGGSREADGIGRESRGAVQVPRGLYAHSVSRLARSELRSKDSVDYRVSLESRAVL